MKKNDIISEEYLGIDIKKYLYLFYKNKFLIIIILLFSLLIGFLISEYIITRTYQAKTILKLSNIENSIYSNPEASAQLIRSKKYLLNINKKYNMDLSNDYIDELLDPENNMFLVTSNEDSIFISIIIKGSQPQTVNNVANNLANNFIQETEKRVKEKQEIISNQINTLKNEKVNLENFDKRIEIILENISKNNQTKLFGSDYIQNNLIEIKKNIQEINLDTLNMIFEYQEKLDNISSAEIINQAEVPEKPVSPNRMQILLISIIFGLFVSILFVYLKDLIKNTNWEEYNK